MICTICFDNFNDALYVALHEHKKVRVCLDFVNPSFTRFYDVTFDDWSKTTLDFLGVVSDASRSCCVGARIAKLHGDLKYREC